MTRASPSSPGPVSIGIDFGTSNTVVALSRPGHPASVVRFRHEGRHASDGTAFISALCFWEDGGRAGKRTRIEGGPWAVEEFLEGLSNHRFIQSFKTFAASSSFQDTRIFGARYRFEDLLHAFLSNVLGHAGVAPDGGSVVVGRPVRFAGGAPDEALAMRRYQSAFDRLGVAAPRFVYEPVGAAFFYAQQLEKDATVLVADFGGGTSDFSVIRFEGTDGARRARPLGHAGVGVAGDTFDYRIIDKVVSPRLGKGGNYRSFDKLLSLPTHYYANFARWNQLAMMKANGDLKELRQLARAAVDPEPLERFIEIVENDLGFALYRAVSAAKIGLSSQDAVDFRFQDGGVDIAARVARADFEGWIAPDIERIAGALDEALARAGTRAEQVERVFLTGGSSFIPAIRRVFLERFGERRLTSSDQFESIASGLALIGGEPDLDRWVAA
ncbi:Hsp70 family protein [Alsobacter sp. SYSU BS001988]